MEKKLKILMVEDVAEDAELVAFELRHAGLDCDIRRVQTAPDFMRELDDFGPDLILSDFTLPQFDGLGALALAHEASPGTPFIFISGTIGEERAIACLKQGAVDYVLKDNPQRIAPAIRRALADVDEHKALHQAEQEAQASGARLSALAEQMHSGVLFEDASHRVQYCNPQFCHMFGISERRPELEGADAHEITRRMGAFFEAPNEFIARTARILEEKLPFSNEQLQLADGRSIERDAIPLLVDDRYLGHWWQYRDVTNHKRQLDNITRLSRVHAVLSNINASIVRVRERGKLFDAVCRIATEHGGFGLAWIGTVEGDTVKIAASSGDHDGYARRTAAALRLVQPAGSHPFNRALIDSKPCVCNNIATDEAFWPWREEALQQGYHAVATLPLLLADKAVGLLCLYAADAYFFVQQEIDLLLELTGQIAFALDSIDKREQLNYLAFYDTLTGLPNRNLFFDRVNQMLPMVRQNNRCAALLVVTINRFKSINDSLGYRIGDALLRKVAQRLKAALREDDVIARSGGDHFLIALNRIADETTVGKVVVEKILESFSLPFDIQGVQPHVSATIGVAVFPHDGADAEGLLRGAESALERARESTASYAFYSLETDAHISEAMELENKLYSAIKNREFRLHYQPKVDLVTGKICGVEALLRWYQPQNIIVPPIKFIPLLEETGMIREVGAWVLQEAVNQSRQWQAQGHPPLKIAVNVSPLQLAQDNFVDEVRQIVGDISLDHLGIEIEVTETVIMGDLGKTQDKLRQLRDLGTEISIDDFGTGYSSLAYLNKLPISSLKIDRSFITDMMRNPNSMTIVSAIISLSHALKLRVIAEGVETEEQLHLLKRLECDEMQGYLFSKPVTPEEISDMLHERRALPPAGATQPSVVDSKPLTPRIDKDWN